MAAVRVRGALHAVPAVLTLVAAGCNGGASKSSQGKKAAAPPPVQVAEVTRQVVPLQIHAIGNVEPFSVVEVKSRVGGEIASVHFEEGQDVRQGQVLFQIDPREFRQAVQQAEAEVAARKAALGQAEATFESALAEARNARAQADRYQDLTKKGIISREQNEQLQTAAVAGEKAAAAAKANIASARAAVEGAEAKLEDARLQLSYATIRAPVPGRTGDLRYKTGNLVTANSAEPLVVINQISPIYTTFTVPEQALGRLRQYAGKGRLTVEAAQPERSGEAAAGILDFLDNAVDPATGTIRLKARFANKDRRLWPGEFVNVTVRLAKTEETVAPSGAIRNAQQGNYVFVVRADSTAEQRSVRAGRTWNGLTVIEKGVEPGETVIVEGQLRVRPGMKVAVRRESGGDQASAGKS